MLEINNTRCSDIHLGAGHPVLRWGMVSMSVGFQEDGWYATAATCEFKRWSLLR